MLHMESHNLDHKIHSRIYLCTFRWCENTTSALRKTGCMSTYSVCSSILPDIHQNIFLSSRRRTHAVITTFVARVSCLVIVAVTSITLFTDPARRVSSGTDSGSCVTRGPGFYIYTTLATSRARGEVWVVTTDTSATRQVTGCTTFTIRNAYGNQELKCNKFYIM